LLALKCACFCNLFCGFVDLIIARSCATNAVGVLCQLKFRLPSKMPSCQVECREIEGIWQNPGLALITNLLSLIEKGSINIILLFSCFLGFCQCPLFFLSIFPGNFLLQSLCYNFLAIDNIPFSELPRIERNSGGFRTFNNLVKIQFTDKIDSIFVILVKFRSYIHFPIHSYVFNLPAIAVRSNTS